MDFRPVSTALSEQVFTLQSLLDSEQHGGVLEEVVVADTHGSAMECKGSEARSIRSLRADAWIGKRAYTPSPGASGSGLLAPPLEGTHFGACVINGASPILSPCSKPPRSKKASTSHLAPPVTRANAGLAGNLVFGIHLLAINMGAETQGATSRGQGRGLGHRGRGQFVDGGCDGLPEAMEVQAGGRNQGGCRGRR